ncbi:hypothetical protein [Serinicoccus sediminis]|uniref:hypothetical protein n=1 Tax=Serinicoccus sediminis TaxID=2306021 RepID=UPI0013E9EB1F|nr:hypothetical protein [Serinicoccus sediminis]
MRPEVWAAAADVVDALEAVIRVGGGAVVLAMIALGILLAACEATRGTSGGGSR